ncbi:hypothetical protein ACFL35_00580 [Candidatus Riflebacteria bacterium]
MRFLVIALIFIAGFLQGCSLFSDSEKSEGITGETGDLVAISGRVDFPANTAVASMQSKIKGSVNFSNLKVFINHVDLARLDENGVFNSNRVVKSNRYLVEIKNANQTNLLKAYGEDSTRLFVINPETTAIAKIFDEHYAVDSSFDLKSLSGSNPKVASITLDITSLLTDPETLNNIPAQDNDITALITDVIDPLFVEITNTPRALTTLLSFKINERIVSATIQLAKDDAGLSSLSLQKFKTLPKLEYFFSISSATVLSRRLYGLATNTVYWSFIQIQDLVGNIGSNSTELSSFTTSKDFEPLTATASFKTGDTTASGSIIFTLNEEVTSYTLFLSSGSFAFNPGLSVNTHATFTASTTELNIDFPKASGAITILKSGEKYGSKLYFQHGEVINSSSIGSFTAP